MSTLAPIGEQRNGREDGPQSDEILDALARIIGSRQLRESAQLQHFFDYIVRETLAGRQDGLKEYTIGCRVFNRKPDYDTRHDGIVRVQATSLRKRLDKYYSDEGTADTVGIELPRGGYVPSFHYRPAVIEVPATVPAVETVEVLPTAQQLPAPATFGRTIRPWAMFAAGVAVALVFAAIAIRWWLPRAQSAAVHRMVEASPSDFPELWGSFFVPGSRSLVGFGVPLFYSFGGLYIRDVKINTPGNEKDGRVLDIARQYGAAAVPNDTTYTGLGEAIGTNLVSSFLTTRGVPVRVTNAHTIGNSELKNNNLVVISSLRFQTLLRARNLPTEFEFIPVSPEVIRNRHPRAGEKAEYVFESGAGVSTSYALVGLWQGAEKDRRILFIGGVHTWATQAATEFVLNPNRLREMAGVFARDRSTGEHGPVSPSFEILLKVEGREDRPLQVEYVTHRYVQAPN
jgi:hypothetical protein